LKDISIQSGRISFCHEDVVITLKTRSSISFTSLIQMEHIKAFHLEKNLWEKILLILKKKLDFFVAWSLPL